MAKTSIEWTDYSWPVLNGCRRKSAGCEHCYAERLAATRLRDTRRYGGLALYGPNGPQWTGESRLDAEELVKPLRWKKPRRIFVCEMGDLFYEGNTNEQIAAVFGVMAACRQHIFQVLTKRPKRALEWHQWVESECAGRFQAPTLATIGANLMNSIGATIGEDEMYGAANRAAGKNLPLKNVHLLVSCEDQATADERIPLLLQCPAFVRGVSLEPLLGPIDLTHLDAEAAGNSQYIVVDALTGRQTDMGRPCPDAPKLDWVIWGSESGPRARPMELEWGASIVRQCRAAGIACFTKQIANARDRKGSNPEYWPSGDWPREFPK
jgi:protein gp37